MSRNGVVRPASVRLTAPATLGVRSAHEFRLALVESMAAARRRVVVDLSGVRAIDEVGAAVLVGAARRSVARGVDLVLAAPSEHVRAVVTRSGLGRALVGAFDAPAADAAR